MTGPPRAVADLSEMLRPLEWVTALWVGGSAATGDYRPGVSDLDLVALTDGSAHSIRLPVLRTLHTALDAGGAKGTDLGCAYVEVERLEDPGAEHPTWTHGSLVRRTLSGISRAELVRHGYAVFGPEPRSVLTPVTDDDVRDAARAELAGYWRTAARRPWWWLDPTIVDLGLTSMARARHEVATGQLLTKTAAVERADAPAWLVDQLRARRHGTEVRSPRLRSGWHAWRDARRTTTAGGAA